MTAMDNQINIVYITDQSFAMPTCVSILSVIVNMDREDNLKIFVVCDGVDESSKERFMLLESDRAKIELIDIHDEKCLGMFASCIYADCIHVTGTALYKLSLAEILKGVRKVIYIDGDTLVQKSLGSLYDYELGDNYVGAVNDMLDECEEGDSGLANRIGLSGRSYFNSGVMLLDLEKIRTDEMSRKLIDYRENGTNYFMDQDALNAVLGDRRTCLPYSYNFLATVTEAYDVDEIAERFCEKKKYSIDECISEAAIIHLTGKRKPWKYNLPWFSRLFFQYYKKSPYCQEDINLISPMKELVCEVKYQERCISNYANVVDVLKEKIRYLKESRDFVVPYDRIEKGCHLILYGAGNVGKSYYKQLTQTEYCKIALWTDIKGEDAGAEVMPPSEICKVEYDYILVAILDKEKAAEAIRVLANEYAVDENKILSI